VSRLLLVVGLLAGMLLALVGCGGPDAAEVERVQAMAAASLKELSAEDIAAVRALSDAYWNAWNEYDVDKVLSMLDEPFRKERGEEIRGNVQKLDRWNMSISVSEVTPPKLDTNGEVVMYVNVKKPLSTDLTQMRFKKVGFSWIITYASKDER